MSVILGPGLRASSPVSVNIPNVSPSVTTQDQGELRDYKDILTLLINVINNTAGFTSIPCIRLSMLC